MKRFLKSMLGVTLLEIMLVLAIAAMIIVMSVRYYQSATASQRVNVALQQIQGYIAAADNLAGGAGNYNNVNSAAIKNVVGSVNYGPPAAFTSFTPGGNPTGSQFTLVVAITPAALCEPLLAQVNSSFGTRAATGTKCETGSLTLVYNPTASPT